MEGSRMITPLLHITLPEDDGEDRHFAPIILALQAMISINEWHIRRALKRTEKGEGVPIPPLYASGVRYKEDPPGEENWCDCLEVLRQGHGDCDRLCAWRVAELRAAGIKAEPLIKWQQVPKHIMIGLGHPAHMVPEEGISMVHVLVGFPGWQSGDPALVEDPSKLLGMGGNFTNGV
jgi:hypothetical protein